MKETKYMAFVFSASISLMALSSVADAAIVGSSPPLALRSRMLQVSGGPWYLTPFAIAGYVVAALAVTIGVGVLVFVYYPRPAKQHGNSTGGNDPGEWRKIESRSKPGKFYYANSRTGQKQWKTPEDYTAQTGDEATDKAASGNTFPSTSSGNYETYTGICGAKPVVEALKKGDPLDLCIMTNTNAGSADETQFQIQVDDYASLRVAQSSTVPAGSGPGDRYMWLAVNNVENPTQEPHSPKVCHVEHDGACGNVKEEALCTLLEGMCAWNATAVEGERCFSDPEPARPAQATTCVQKYGDNNGVLVAFVNVEIHMERGLIKMVKLANDASHCSAEDEVVSATKLMRDGAPDKNATKRVPSNNVCRTRTEDKDTTTDLKVFVSFFGTDKDGVYLNSSQLSRAMFNTADSIKVAWASLKEKVTDYTRVAKLAVDVVSR